MSFDFSQGPTVFQQAFGKYGFAIWRTLLAVAIAAFLGSVGFAALHGYATLRSDYPGVVHTSVQTEPKTKTENVPPKARTTSQSSGLADYALQLNGCGTINITGGNFSGFRRAITAPPCANVNVNGTDFNNGGSAVEMRSPSEPAQAPIINNQGGIYAPNQSGGQNTINNYGIQQRNLNGPEFATLRTQLESLPKDQDYAVGFTVNGSDNAAFAGQIRDYLSATGHKIRGSLVTIVGSQTGVTYDPVHHNLAVGPSQ
jgi:hypothetical protein